MLAVRERIRVRQLWEAIIQKYFSEGNFRMTNDDISDAVQPDRSAGYSGYAVP